MASPSVLDLLQARTDLLDPRPGADARRQPILGAVNIPAPELRARLHELPAPDQVLRVADVEGATAALDFLSQGARTATLSPEFVYGDGGGPPLRLWDPNPLVAEEMRTAAPGRALDLGCGAGRDAVMLALGGWEVTAVDHLPDAVQRAEELAGRFGVSLALLNADAALVEIQPPFDLALSLRFLNPAALARVAGWLRPGGRLLVEGFTNEHGRGSSASREQIEEWIAPLRTIRYEDGPRGRAHTARLIAVKDA